MPFSESRGKKVQDIVMEEPWEEDWDVLHDFAYEVKHRFSFERKVNRYEARTLIDGFFTRWAVKHPDMELRFMEIKGLSKREAEASGLAPPAYETTVHVIHRSPEVTAGAIAAAIASVLAFVAANALEIAVVSALVIGIIGLWRLMNYFVPEEQVYRCPKDGEKFDQYHNFKAHFKAKHPEQKVPPKPANWTDYLKYVALGVGGALAFRIAWPALRGE